MTILIPTDVIRFGKNSGFTLAEIYKYQPSYIEWLIMQTKEITIDIDSFKALPNPTPFSYLSKAERDEIESDSKLTLAEKMLKLYDSNSALDIHSIKGLEIQGQKLPEIDYSFPDSVVRRNNTKIEMERLSNRTNEGEFEPSGDWVPDSGNSWTCDVCDGNSETGCLASDPDICPNR